MCGGPVDVSQLFWPFVRAVNRCSCSDEIKNTPEYEGLRALLDFDKWHDSFWIHESVLVPFDALDALPLGVMFDDSSRCYVFRDINALFLASLEILQNNGVQDTVHEMSEALRHCIASVYRAMDSETATDLMRKLVI